SSRPNELTARNPSARLSFSLSLPRVLKMISDPLFPSIVTRLTSLISSRPELLESLNSCPVTVPTTIVAAQSMYSVLNFVVFIVTVDLKVLHSKFPKINFAIVGSEVHVHTSAIDRTLYPVGQLNHPFTLRS